MRNLILTFVLLVMSVVCFGQNKCELVLKPNKTVTGFFKINYNWKWCRTADIKVEGNLDVNKEIITLKLSYKNSAKRKKLDYVWFPVEAVEYDDIKSYLSTDGKNVKTAFIFNRQYKKGKWKDDSQAFTSSNAEVIECYLTSEDEIDFDNEQKMLRLDDNSSVIIKLLILKNSENVKVVINNIVPIVDKKNNRKLIYLANKVVLDIIVDRNGCYGHKKQLDRINAELEFYKSQERNFILDRNNSAAEDCDSIMVIKKNLLDGYNAKDYDEYRYSECSDIRESMREIDSICLRISNIDCENCVEAINELSIIYSNLLQTKNKLTELYNTGKLNDFMKEKEKSIYYVNSLNLKKFERSDCNDPSNYYKKVKNLISQIRKIDQECKNSKQISELKDKIKKASSEINRLYNDWICTTDTSKKIALKSDRDKICNEIDAEIGSLSSGCKNLLGDQLHYYESAKSLNFN